MIEAAKEEAAGNYEAGAAASVNFTVADVMKPREMVPTYDLSYTMQRAFEDLLDSKQNCALVVDNTDSSAAGEGPAGENAGAQGSVKQEETEADANMEPAEEDSEIGGPLHGVLTTADVLRAFSERRTGTSTNLASWLRSTARRTPPVSKRTIASNASLSEAVTAMTAANVHHLLVVASDGSEVLGVVSALDIVCAIGDFYTSSLEADTFEMTV